MTAIEGTPFDPWASLVAWQQTWLASTDVAGVGRLLQQQRLARLLDWAGSRSPLYARRSPGAGGLEDLAPIGKAELMANFDEWATDRRITLAGARHFLSTAGNVADAWLGSYLVWTSSGTSGEPGIFVQDAASLAAHDAMEAQRLRGMPTSAVALEAWATGRRLAYVAAVSGPYAGHVSLERLGRLLPPPWGPRVTKISVLLPLTEIAQQLQRLQPDWLVTYPSCAVALARHQAAGDLRLQLRELWLGGEQLSDAQAGLLHEVFGCPVRNSYGASEAYSMACGCRLGRLHLNADWVILEPVDAHRRPVARGTWSHMALLTNLANFTQPLLRYELTDRLRLLEDPCPCGNPWPVIEVRGRSDDALVLPGRGGGRVTLLPLALETVLEEEAGISEFQLILRPQGVLELRLSGLDTAATGARRAREALRRCLDEHGVVHVRTVLGREPPQRQPGSGKLRRVIAAAPRAPAPVSSAARPHR